MCTFATHPYVHTVHADIARATSIHTYGIHGLFVLGVLANLCEPCLCACLWRKLFVCLFIDASIYLFFFVVNETRRWRNSIFQFWAFAKNDLVSFVIK